MDVLVTLNKWGGIALLVSFSVLVIWKIVTGEIPLTGLLESVNPEGRRSFSPGRAQLLVFTLFVSVRYLLAVIQNPNGDSLPDLPAELIAVLGGSQAIYAGGKALSTFFPSFTKPK